MAIARAIVADPTLVLLDEPTGQLDAKSSQEVLALLARLNDEFGKTILIVTHDPAAARPRQAPAAPGEGDVRGAGGALARMKFWSPAARQPGPAQAAHVPHHRQRGAGAVPVRLAPHASSPPSAPAAQFGSARRLVTTNATGFVLPLPVSYANRLAAVPGRGEGDLGQLVRRPLRRRQALLRARSPSMPKSYLEIYPEMSVPADQKEAFLQDKGGGADRRRGWSTSSAGRWGRTSPSQGTIFPGDWTFTIRGVYTPTDPAINDDALMFHYDYLDERIGPAGAARGGTSCRSTTPDNAAPDRQDDRRPVPELAGAHQDRHRAGVQRQLRHDVGEHRPADEHDRPGGGVRHPAGDRQRDDDERPRAHPRAGGAQDHRLLRPAAVRAGAGRGGA